MAVNLLNIGTFSSTTLLSDHCQPTLGGRESRQRGLLGKPLEQDGGSQTNKVSV